MQLQTVGLIEKDNYKVEKTELTVENLKKYADGRVFTGQIAEKTWFY